MALRLNIARKIFLGYILIVGVAGTATVITLSGLKKNREINERIANVYVPSVSYLNDLHNLVANSKMLIKNWVFVSSKPQTAEKLRLKQIQEEDFPQLSDRLDMMRVNWPEPDRLVYGQIARIIRDSLFPMQQYVMSLLSDFESYNRPSVVFEATSMVEEDNDAIMQLTNQVLGLLDQLIASQEVRVWQAKQEMKGSFEHFRWMVAGLGFLVIGASLVSALYTVRSVVRPINMLTAATRELSEDNLEVQVLLSSEDELQVLADAFNQMTVSLKENRARLESVNLSLEDERNKLEDALSALRDSQKLLEEANVSRERILAIVAHDMKNSFSSLISLTNQLSQSWDSLDNSIREEYAVRIRQSVRNLYGITENLLSWAAVSSGRMPFNPASQDLREMVHSTFSQLEEPARRKGIRLTSALREPHLVFADRDMILAVIRNLVQNAIKFSGERNEILVHAFEDDAWVHLVVKDHGTGMNDEDMRFLFRIDPETKRNRNSRESTGLGLILSKQLVEKNNGFIQVKSLPGEGSEFTISLPKRPETDDKA